MPSANYAGIVAWVRVSVWNSGAGKLGEHTYEPLRDFPSAAVHIGYEL